MKARNNVEEKVLQLLAEGQKLHGWARDVYIEMILREQEEQEEKQAGAY